jgi:hypothetical protein
LKAGPLISFFKAVSARDSTVRFPHSPNQIVAARYHSCGMNVAPTIIVGTIRDFAISVNLLPEKFNPHPTWNKHE